MTGTVQGIDKAVVDKLEYFFIQCTYFSVLQTGDAKAVVGKPDAAFPICYDIGIMGIHGAVGQVGKAWYVSVEYRLLAMVVV